MDYTEEDIKEFIKSELMMLYPKSTIIKKTKKTFNIDKSQVLGHYSIAKKEIKKKAKINAIIYLMLCIPALAGGFLGTFGNSGFIFIGAMLTGVAFAITSICYIKISL